MLGTFVQLLHNLTNTEQAVQGQTMINDRLKPGMLTAAVPHSKSGLFTQKCLCATVTPDATMNPTVPFLLPENFWESLRGSTEQGLHTARAAELGEQQALPICHEVILSIIHFQSY